MIKNLYANQIINVKYGNAFSSTSWQLKKGCRQGGIMSPLLFNVYIDSLIKEISECKMGCKLGTTASNIIAYADDIVLLTPSLSSMQYLIDKIAIGLKNIDLEININKTVWMKLSNKSTSKADLVVKIDGFDIKRVCSFKYLGFIISDDLSNTLDITRARNKFFNEFNVILRKFNSSHPDVLFSLFRAYCLNFYGTALWLDLKNCSQVYSQFEIGYHKAVKKIFKYSMRSSNHEVCLKAGVLTFKHYVNLIQVKFLFKNLYTNPCPFVDMIKQHILNTSDLINKFQNNFLSTYSVPNVFLNDFKAVEARINFVCRNEDRLR